MVDLLVEALAFLGFGSVGATGLARRVHFAPFTGCYDTPKKIESNRLKRQRRHSTATDDPQSFRRRRHSNGQCNRPWMETRLPSASNPSEAGA